MKRFLLLLCVAACGPLTPPQLDGGAVGGGVANPVGGGTTGGGVGSTGGGDGVTGGGVGSTGGAGGGVSASGGGAGGTGGGAGWSFGAVSLSTASTSAGTMVGVVQNSVGIWALSSTSRLFLSTGGAFTEQVQLTQLSNPFAPITFRGDSSGRLFFVSATWVGWCDSGCTDNANWNYEQIQSGSTWLTDACVTPDGNVLAIGGQGSGYAGVGYLLIGDTLSPSPTALGVNYPRRCWTANSGDLRIAAQGAVGRYDGLQFTADASSNTNTMWLAGASVPGHDWVFAAGLKVAESPGWTVTDVGTSIHQIYAAIYVSPTLTWGFGGSGLSQPTKLWRFDGTNWAAANPDLTGFKLVNAAIKASDGSIYFAGTGPDDKPAIGRGVLQ